MQRTSAMAALAGLVFRPSACKKFLSALVRDVRTESTFSTLYDKYAGHTMIARGTYIHNLELVDKHRDVAGCVIECGVWRGGMIAGVAELLGPEREYVLCDSFEGLPPAKEIDGAAAKAWQANTASPEYHDNCKAEREVAEQAMRLAGARHVTIRQGWFNETLKGYTPPGPIAVLRLDGDWYDSTMACLEYLVQHIAPGGIVIVDDYATWDGCRKAVHDYLSRTQSSAQILRWRDDVSYIQVPSR